MSDGKNPYIERGLALTADEYNLVTAALTLLAEHADQQNQPEMRPPCVRLIVRMKQIVHAGEGMTPEVAERYGRRIAKAMETGNADAISRGVADLLAASLRLDADPADKIGAMLSELVRTGVEEMARRMVGQFLGEFRTILEEARKGWAESGWPEDPGEAMAWVSEVVVMGVQNIAEGHEPWPIEEAAPAQGGADAVSA